MGMGTADGLDQSVASSEDPSNTSGWMDLAEYAYSAASDALIEVGARDQDDPFIGQNIGEARCLLF